MSAWVMTFVRTETNSASAVDGSVFPSFGEYPLFASIVVNAATNIDN
jgi:hypothetical protein